MRYFIRVMAVLFLFTPLTSFSAVQASIDRDQIGINEMLKLEISTDQTNASKPDFSIFEKDFSIASMGESLSMQMVNGQITQEKRWILSLIPKKSGTITVPAISVGSEKTQPLKLTVTKQLSPQQPKDLKDDFLIETTIEPKEAYWQQPVLYSVRIWASKPLANAQFTPPSVSEGATINAIGKQTNTMTNRSGRQYDVIEKQYLITPNKVGELTIHPPELRGLAFDNQQASLFYGGGEPKPVELSGKELKLSVKEKPSSWQDQWWLPAAKISLKQEWSQDPQKWSVGTPITRILTIQGEGVSAEQIPDLKISTPSDINVYPDKSEITNRVDRHTLIGKRQIKVALVPTQAGEWELPAIKVPWWNVKTKQREVAELPAFPLKILAEQGAAAALQKTPENGNKSQDAVSEGAQIKKETGILPGQWLIIILIALLVLSFVTIIMLWRKLDSNHKTFDAKGQKPQKMSQSKKQAIDKIKKACLANNPREIIKATLVWAQIQWPKEHISTLEEVSSRLQHPDFSQKIKELLAACYSDKPAHWKAEDYWKSFESLSLVMQNEKKKTDEPLPPLFK